MINQGGSWLVHLHSRTLESVALSESTVAALGLHEAVQLDRAWVMIVILGTFPIGRGDSVLETRIPTSTSEIGLQ